jgi:hypothetical protein
MSFSGISSRIICDSLGCRATVGIPIGLHPTLARQGNEIPQIAGWLFLVSRHGTRHFCPQCLAQWPNGLSIPRFRQETFE